MPGQCVHPLRHRTAGVSFVPADISAASTSAGTNHGPSARSQERERAVQRRDILVWKMDTPIIVTATEAMIAR